jgi:hypothetical protein
MTITPQKPIQRADKTVVKLSKLHKKVLYHTWDMDRNRKGHGTQKDCRREAGSVASGELNGRGVGQGGNSYENWEREHFRMLGMKQVSEVQETRFTSPRLYISIKNPVDILLKTT